MSFNRMNKKAFTVFEIIIAMLVVGILSALAAPKVVDLVNEARRGDELNTVGNVKSGIALTYLGNVTRGITPQYPQNLDNATLAKASPSNPVYDLVLQHGITKSWEKLETYRYRGPTGQEYEYDPADGTFDAVEAAVPPPPVVTFMATYGGGGFDLASSAFMTSDGGYIIAGYTDSLGDGSGEFYLVKTDADGNMIWEKFYGGSGFDYLVTMRETSDGGYIMSGYTDSFGVGGDAYLVKINSSGDIQWENTYGGTGFDWLSSIQETSDGNYIIAGETESFGGTGEDAYLAKIDSSNGTLLWDTTYGGMDYNGAYGVEVAPDGGYVMAGFTIAGYPGPGPYSWDYYLVKTSSIGETQWVADTNLSWTGDSADVIQATTDGGYVITGYYESIGTGADIPLVKIDSSGATVWEKTYAVSDEQVAYGVQVTPDEGYIIWGVTQPTSAGGIGWIDGYVVKINSLGDVQWTKTYGTDGYAAGDYINSVQVAPDGGYIISGNTNTTDTGTTDAWLIRTDANGNVVE